MTEQVENKNLYVSVKTFNNVNESIGYRVVDQYHYGTRNWLLKHLWWAMHNGHIVEVVTSTDEEIAEYLEASAKALAEKYNKVA